jgi:hypothetical protein
MGMASTPSGALSGSSGSLSVTIDESVDRVSVNIPQCRMFARDAV